MCGRFTLTVTGDELLDMIDRLTTETKVIFELTQEEIDEDLDRSVSEQRTTSVKAASDVYAPIAGAITAVNDELSDDPEKINADPYGDGWIVKMQPADDADESAAFINDGNAAEISTDQTFANLFQRRILVKRDNIGGHRMIDGMLAQVGIGQTVDGVLFEQIIEYVFLGDDAGQRLVLVKDGNTGHIPVN